MKHFFLMALAVIAFTFSGCEEPDTTPEAVVMIETWDLYGNSFDATVTTYDGYTRNFSIYFTSSDELVMKDRDGIFYRGTYSENNGKITASNTHLNSNDTLIPFDASVTQIFNFLDGIYTGKTYKVELDGYLYDIKVNSVSEGIESDVRDITYNYKDDTLSEFSDYYFDYYSNLASEPVRP